MQNKIIKMILVIIAVAMVASVMSACMRGRTGLILEESSLECSSNSDCGTCFVCPTGTCIHNLDPECCLSDNDCAAGFVCDLQTNKCVECLTDDDCAEGLVCNLENKCVQCLTDAQCEDGTICTTDLCEANACIHSPVSGCCNSNIDCDDGDVCTADTCDQATGLCDYAKIQDCCNFDYECDDGNACTGEEGDVCVDNVCVSGAPIDCEDSNPCTEDTCVDSTCQHTQLTCNMEEKDGCCPQGCYDMSTSPPTSLDSDCVPYDLCAAKLKGNPSKPDPQCTLPDETPFVACCFSDSICGQDEAGHCCLLDNAPCSDNTGACCPGATCSKAGYCIR
jgi:Cys-rich repeat protein